MVPISVFTALCLLQLVVTAPTGPAETTKNSNLDHLVMETSGMPNSYKFYYDTKDGSSRVEEGNMLEPGTDRANLDVHGAVSWQDDKGHTYQMVYKAGTRGYRTIIKRIS